MLKTLREKEVNHSSLKFYENKHSSKTSNCPACDGPNSKVVLTFKEASNAYTLISCSQCGTLYYPNAKAPDYEIVENESSFYMRIDQAEGIDSSLMPLFSVPGLKNHAVIDIGCGLGFTSDFVRFQGRECLAFDPSSASKISSEILKIDIAQSYASPLNTQTNSTDKLVFASEVIEHVENPSGFLRQLRTIAGENGYLIITTPNADYVKNGNSTNVIVAMLGPSQHLFLLSGRALEDLAKQAGFFWTESWTQNERLFMVAGPKPQLISNHFSRLEYIGYLANRLVDERIDETIRYRSFGYRLFKEYVNGARYEEASELWEQIVLKYETYGLNLQSPKNIVEKYRQAIGVDLSLPDYVRFPYNIALLMFLKGTLLIASDHDRIAAKPYFDASIAISDLYRKAHSKGNFQSYDLELQNVGIWAKEQIILHSL
jgi:2-polyprenyl-3-methyl-5-hydroxy-6-metoxy-1,4-benzoquinol methylase